MGRGSQNNLLYDNTHLVTRQESKLKSQGQSNRSTFLPNSSVPQFNFNNQVMESANNAAKYWFTTDLDLWNENLSHDYMLYGTEFWNVISQQGPTPVNDWHQQFISSGGLEKIAPGKLGRELIKDLFASLDAGYQQEYQQNYQLDSPVSTLTASQSFNLADNQLFSSSGEPLFTIDRLTKAGIQAVEELTAAKHWCLFAAQRSYFLLDLD